MSKRLPLISIAAFSLLLAVLAGCGKSNRLDAPSAVMDKSLPDETSTNVTIIEFNKGKVDYILKAAKIERYYDKRLLNAYQVDITAFNEKEKEPTLLKADSTIVDDARNLIHAHGHVILKSPGGEVNTTRLTWDRNVDEIIAPDRVTLIREGNVLRGKNLRTNLSIYPTEMDSVSAEGFFGQEYLDW
ncbi:MAG TPA: LPS export ABC transporter periplasmic protein LptC [Candidatus Syntrophosphaera sp.]|jgi:LPS export ABC transporter protein LptC|nr:LPS export ABC transporter periplasmic protein LptC [Candidatus Syntrophosphaera sp.]